ncbi:xylose isomerase-like TIM barrel protein [Anaerobacterium chartisolvens]|uniref:Xylose isomerase-like TIM barrel protein n=1 Tax=Anaerobacterium chartisolvens TaxID=1297424 RepID=A0A369ALF3_9FIRM|nr:TIM barrel protein [Anaerobacterium chartisolvens]RCX09925.1 xylose isomerase-like TIM barrel protein [Anaerobacterium chartisolvens]
MSNIKRSVSMYSLQDEYARGSMKLPEIFEYLNGMGTGLEFISDQMMHNTPEPTEEDLKVWDSLVEKYEPTLVCNDIFINTCLYKNRSFTKKESINALIKEIKLANRLGFKMVRLVSKTQADIIEPVLSYAEKYNVILSLEIHAGMSFDNPHTQEFVEVMRKLNSPYVGLTIDTGIFCRRQPRVFANYFRHLGVNEELIALTDKVFASGSDMKVYNTENGKPGERFAKDVAALIKTPAETQYAFLADGYENSPFDILDEYMPYATHFHGKIFEMTEEGIEYSIPFDELIKYLDQKGYKGYISTEYEGNRWTLPGSPMKEKENTEAHQALLKKCIEEL